MIDIKNIPEVSDTNLAFAGVDHYLPKWEEIPEEFKRHHGTKWNKLFGDWFYMGIKEWDMKIQEGVDPIKAARLLSALMRSFASKHEHKEAGVAYLMSLFFTDDSTWTPGE